MATIQKNDFVEIEYTGKLKETGSIFDTTDEALAKKEEIYSAKTKYGPLTVCIGQQNLVQGLDNALIGKEIGKELEISLVPEEAFGKKNAKMIQLIPTKKFMQQGINPLPGLQVNIDGIMGLVKKTGGGRTMVDFNHPLAGQEIVYKVKVNKKVDNPEQKIKSILELLLNAKDVQVKMNNDIAEVKFKNSDKIPEQIKNEIIKKIKELVKELKEIKIMS